MAQPAEEKVEEVATVSALITGANRGLGLAFVKLLLKRPGFNIFACCRTPDKAEELKKLQTANEGRVHILKMEMTSDDDVAAVAKAVGDTPVDLLMLNAGIMGEKAEDDALRKMGTLKRADFLNVFNVNVVGNMLLGQALYDNVKKSGRKQIIGMSSGMGSIADCGSNFAVPYRCSKAALGMAMQSFAKESEKNKDGVHAMVLLPGWVSTDMGGKNATLTPEQSCTQMLTVIDSWKERTNGGFYSYTGKTYPW